MVVGGYPILVDLTYIGKPRTALVEANLQAEKAGVLTLDCDSFLFSSLRNNCDKRFSEAVAEFVLITAERKNKWSSITFSLLVFLPILLNFSVFYCS